MLSTTMFQRLSKLKDLVKREESARGAEGSRDTRINKVYRWTPLDTQRNELRLLELHGTCHKKDELVIVGTLKHFSTRQFPAYHALSYSWGSREVRRTILLDGVPHRITENLYEALLMVQIRGTRHIWIDAICINQNDPIEKAAQVLRMATIFQEAAKVLVWLGSAKPNTANLFDFMSKAHTSTVYKLFWAEDFLLTDGLGFWHFNEVLLDLLSCEYWQRMWIVQEIAVATRIEILWGASSVDGAVFESLFSQAQWEVVLSSNFDQWWHPHTERYFKHLLSIWNIRSLLRTRKPIDLLSLLFELRWSKTTEHVDRVYCLLGLAFDHKAFLVEPDYSLKAHELSCLMTQRFIQTTQSLDVLFLSSFGANHESVFEDCTCTVSWHTEFMHLYWERLHLEDKLKTAVDYINGKLRKQRCGELRESWNTTESSLVDIVNCFSGEQDLEVRGLKLVQIQSDEVMWKDLESSGNEQRGLLFASICRLLLIYSDFYQDEQYMRSVFLVILNEIGEYDEDVKYANAFERIGSFHSVSKLRHWLEFSSDQMTAFFTRDWKSDWYPRESTIEKCNPTEINRLGLIKTADFSLSGETTAVVAADVRDALERILEILTEFPDLTLVDEESVFMTLKQPSVGDEIWLLEGCSMPVVLRCVQAGVESDLANYTLQSYGVLDSAKIQDKRCNVMNGEAWRTAKDEDFQMIRLV